MSSTKLVFKDSQIDTGAYAQVGPGLSMLFILYDFSYELLSFTLHCSSPPKHKMQLMPSLRIQKSFANAVSHGIIS